jgi:RNA polymerase sigma factor (sigma-70 family)
MGIHPFPSFMKADDRQHPLDDLIARSYRPAKPTRPTDAVGPTTAWRMAYEFAARAVLDVHEAEDIASYVRDTLFPTEGHARLAADIDGLRAQIYERVRNRFKDWCRTNKRRRLAEPNIARHHLERADNPDPATVFALKERSEAIDRAFARLPEQQRKVITMRYVKGLKIKEIARILDIEDRTVEAHLRAAKKRLSVLLRDYGPDTTSKEIQ